MKNLASAVDMIFGKEAKVETKETLKVSETSELPDISKVNVPNDFRAKLIESSLSKTKKKVVEPTVVVEEEKIDEETKILQLEEKIGNLISSLTSLLKEAKEVINEVTTVGMIGTNNKFTFKGKGKKNEPSKPNSRNKS